MGAGGYGPGPGGSGRGSGRGGRGGGGRSGGQRGLVGITAGADRDARTAATSRAGAGGAGLRAAGHTGMGPDLGGAARGFAAPSLDVLDPRDVQAQRTAAYMSRAQAALADPSHPEHGAYARSAAIGEGILGLAPIGLGLMAGPMGTAMSTAFGGLSGRGIVGRLTGGGLMGMMGDPGAQRAGREGLAGLVPGGLRGAAAAGSGIGGFVRGLLRGGGTGGRPTGGRMSEDFPGR